MRQHGPCQREGRRDDNRPVDVKKMVLQGQQGQASDLVPPRRHSLAPHQVPNRNVVVGGRVKVVLARNDGIDVHVLAICIQLLVL